MICRKNELECFEKEMFGGPGTTCFTKIVPEEGLGGKGRLFNIALLKPGSAIGPHTHKGEKEIYYILEGQGLYTDNDRQIPVKAGDVTVCEDGERHGLLNDGQSDLKFVALILYTN
ncbi:MULTISPECIES: cupin domain-containing protein [unclassified Desulfovibrio]|uniref:cupin domain-containing protein n=1 Tax=unclassified Desulfovibrio TaxID=2593640 RepID=UPI000F5EB91E|nr:MULTISPECIES: cupin domain-containing protein [unclassified Desulfovibrio]RRD69981.1 cupin domain-containing protein [Desulfovibrio sp. OH1209_COT-279]RRD86539.1 cupin domain-containing protein [Desulfovibrio sp. OH1186_COT-070]